MGVTESSRMSHASVWGFGNRGGGETGVRTLKLSGLPWKATEADVRKFLTNVSIVDGSISIIEDGWCVPCRRNASSS